jgi:hypothetical protein
MAIEIGLNALDGIELSGVEVGIGNPNGERGLQLTYQVGQAEGIEEAGLEERVNGLNVDGFAGNAAHNFNELVLFVH